MSFQNKLKNLRKAYKLSTKLEDEKLEKALTALSEEYPELLESEYVPNDEKAELLTDMTEEEFKKYQDEKNGWGAFYRKYLK